MRHVQVIALVLLTPGAIARMAGRVTLGAVPGHVKVIALLQEYVSVEVGQRVIAQLVLVVATIDKYFDLCKIRKRT